MKALLAAAATLAVAASMPAAAQQRALSDPVVGAPNPEALFTSKDPKLNRNKQAALHIHARAAEVPRVEPRGRVADRQVHPAQPCREPRASRAWSITSPRSPSSSRADPARHADQPDRRGPGGGRLCHHQHRAHAADPGRPAGETYTTTWFDMYRFVNGKADEHWDPMALGAGPGPSASASKPAASGSGTAESVSSRDADRDAIEALQWRYDRALDTFNADAYVALYTPDGSFGQVKGREALHKMMTGFTGPRPAASGAAAAPAGPPHLQHATSNDWVEFTGPDSARIHYYWQTYALSSSGKLGDPPKLLAAGNGVDEVVRQNGQWLFKSRTVTAPND